MTVTQNSQKVNPKANRKATRKANRNLKCDASSRQQAKQCRNHTGSCNRNAGSTGDGFRPLPDRLNAPPPGAQWSEELRFLATKICNHFAISDIRQILEKPAHYPPGKFWDVAMLNKVYALTQCQISITKLRQRLEIEILKRTKNGATHLYVPIKPFLVKQDISKVLKELDPSLRRKKASAASQKNQDQSVRSDTDIKPSNIADVNIPQSFHQNFNNHIQVTTICAIQTPSRIAQ